MGEATPSPKMACVFHGPRTRALFQCLLNKIRHSGFPLIPKGHIRSVGPAICKCRMRNFHRKLDDALEEQHPGYAQNEFQRFAHNHNLVETLETLEKLLALCNKETSCQHACQRLVCLLYWATTDSRVLQEFVDDTKSVEAEIPQTRSNSPTVHEYRFSLKFPSHYIGLLFGSNGKNIKEFAKKHDCQLVVVGNTRKDGFSSNPRDVEFKATFEDPGQGVEIERALARLMGDIHQKREAHLKRVVMFQEKGQKLAAARRARRHDTYDDMMLCSRSSASNTGFYAAAMNRKFDATDNYSTKYQHMVKSKSVRRQEKTQAKPKVLDNANTRCVNCLMEFNNDMGPNCKYHKGYLKMFAGYVRGRGRFRTTKGSDVLKWTCCQDVTVKDMTRHSEQTSHHQATGCISEVRHVWKPHKKPPLAKHSGKSLEGKTAMEDAWITRKES